MDFSEGNNINIGTLNCRGLRREYAETSLANDMKKYQLHMLAVQETHFKGTETRTLQTTDGTDKYTFFFTGPENNKWHGVGIVVSQTLKAQFKIISNRICIATTKLPSNRKLHFICAYAPTLSNSEKNPQTRQEFYDQLESAITEISNRDILIVAGDFNAKTGSGYEQFPMNMGKFGKGKLNKNGEFLLECALKNELIITNTLFQHKMSHRTTWECPQRIVDHKDQITGTIRKNPYRNQIDYILVRIKHRSLVTNSRSYSGIETYSDHRLVKTNMQIKWNKVKFFHGSKNTNHHINVQRLQDPVCRQLYSEAVVKLLEGRSTSTKKTETAQEKWDIVKTACIKAGETIIGKKPPQTKKCENETVKELSLKQKELGQKINACANKTERREMQQERNGMMKEIHRIISDEKTAKIINTVEEIERHKKDSNRMYHAVRALRQTEPKKNILVNGEDGLTTNVEEQLEIITDFFKATFSKDNVSEIDNIEPAEMAIPFSASEIETAAKCLKNNKSPGIDNMNAELLKYGPEEVYQEIADIFNRIAETGEIPQEIQQGILIPVPKPGKPQGPPGNLRPIILLSTLRKILSICMISRIHDKLYSKIPNSQAAYRPGRSTTEHVFAFKCLAEKAITSSNYEIIIEMLDMSKAFNTVDRGKLFQTLKEILNDDELHLMKVLIRDVQLQARIRNQFGTIFNTNIGVPQGDCLSPVLFTLYLAMALNDKFQHPELQLQDHNYAKQSTAGEDLLPRHLQDHTYSVKRDIYLDINLQYADDISWISNAEHKIENVKKQIPAKLSKYNLHVNEGKTEEHKIRRGGDDSWQKCKYLGTLLDTNCDISRRKRLAIIAYNKLNHIFSSKKVSLKQKQRIFNAYVESIFLYNSEIWTLTKKLEEDIDIFQRSMLRKLLNIRWPRKISNKDLYEKLQETEWSKKIKKRRLLWIGHLFRLPEDAPAKQALQECVRPVKRPRGKPKATWIASVEKELREINLNFQTANELAQERQNWRKTVDGAVSNTDETRP